MAHTIDTNLAGAGRAAAKPLRAFGKTRRFVVKCLQIMVVWQERAEQRHALRELNERMLKDIGVSGADAVLLNTAIAQASEPVLMAEAMRHAVQAGRLAFLAGRIEKKRYASASSPLTGTIHATTRA